MYTLTYILTVATVEERRWCKFSVVQVIVAELPQSGRKLYSWKSIALDWSTLHTEEQKRKTVKLWANMYSFRDVFIH